MARVVIGRLRFRVRGEPRAQLRRFEEQATGGAPAVLQASEDRVFSAVRADTPVKTGYMRDHLRKTSESGEVTDRYEVFFLRSDFEGQISRAGNLIEGFPPEEIILGTPERAADDFMTPALERERPQLVRELAQHFQRAARGR